MLGGVENWYWACGFGCCCFGLLLIGGGSGSKLRFCWSLPVPPEVDEAEVLPGNPTNSQLTRSLPTSLWRLFLLMRILLAKAEAAEGGLLSASHIFGARSKSQRVLDYFKVTMMTKCDNRSVTTVDSCNTADWLSMLASLVWGCNQSTFCQQEDSQKHHLSIRLDSVVNFWGDNFAKNMFGWTLKILDLGGWEWQKDKLEMGYCLSSINMAQLGWLCCYCTQHGNNMLWQGETREMTYSIRLISVLVLFSLIRRVGKN